MAKYKVEIDAEQCTGCGACTACCPDSFDMKDDDSGMPKAVVKTPDVDEISAIKDAAEVCPVACIHITETETGKKLI
ncbi:MAG: ferredoxin [Nanoarchaeota archaeon]|nr:ferredoxin [Nanoarchaeota archaeon]MBU1321417.1 ferredoxin [Nanoarchaeota archaeon]MBU1597043.1 ferredoxin [Nanoarchaeota archaeon]MBU2440833.1 ferredoxin [Nanoarchaeota archaeon]